MLLTDDGHDQIAVLDARSFGPKLGGYQDDSSGGQGWGEEGRKREKFGLTSIKIKFLMLLGTPYPALDLNLDREVQSQAQMASVLRKLAQTTVDSVFSEGRRPWTSSEQSNGGKVALPLQPPLLRPSYNSSILQRPWGLHKLFLFVSTPGFRKGPRTNSHRELND